MDDAFETLQRIIQEEKGKISDLWRCEKMDISFTLGNDKFNYRVCAMIISDGKILAMHDDRSPYYYLPGGRVAIGETAENAVIREVQEELGITLKIIRPLWLNQAFFTEDVDNLNYHELCIYFLMDIADTDLLARGKQFVLNEGHRIHNFEWLEFERLQDEYFYPLFLKKDIFNIPNVFTIRTEVERQKPICRTFEIGSPEEQLKSDRTIESDILQNLDKLHTTELGNIRIKKNLSLDTDNVVEWCKAKIKSENASFYRKGKNWYIDIDDCIITINAYSYTIITAHKERK